MSDLPDTIVARISDLDTVEPDDALAIYTEISAALVDALDGADGAARPL